MYIRGNQNVVADCLSRPSINAVTVDVIDLPTLASQHKLDEEIKQYMQQLKPFEIAKYKNILCDLSTPYPQPSVPKPATKEIFNYFYNISYPGINPTLKLIRSHYFWPEMDKTVKL